MYQRIVASVRPHFDALSQLSTRDVPLQLASLALICALCWHIGHPLVAAVSFAVLALSEYVLSALLFQKPPFAQVERDTVIASVISISSVNTVLYLLPGLFLTSDPSLAVKITGLLWIMGIQVYIANTWTRIPAVLAAMLLPAMIMLVAAFFMLRQTPPEPSSMTHWGIAMGFLVIFLYTSVDTLRQDLATQADLVNAQKEAASRLARLEDLSRMDTLTGLLNRRAFDKALHVMLEDRAVQGGELCVLLLDLDSFKPINDTYSHEAGDEVLIQTAQRLSEYVGEQGIVGRLGGDEFICAIQDIPTATAALEYAHALARRLSDTIHWQGRKLKIGASVGVAITGDPETSPVAEVAAMCVAADQAMFVAKSSPRSLPVLYQRPLFAPRMTPEDKHLLIESIANRALKPHYQPKIHLPTGQIIGFEALSRWDHPTDGTRYPIDFITQINELGLQGDFLNAMARQVMEDVERMLTLGLDPGQVSLNVPEVALATHSGRQDLSMLIDQHPKAAQHLTFEITEDVFIARAADTIQASIQAFRAAGVRISLDDFGTGFASFHHLRQLDFDELKIDTSFVAGLGHDSTSEVLVRGFLNIASGLGVSVIAEGVETEHQRRDLINMGCLSAQGYLFSAAVPFDAATDLLRDQNAA